MDVILRQDVETLGRAGELVAVKDGYARNYLLPRGLAYQATDANRKRLESERSGKAKRHAGEIAEAQAVAARLEPLSLTFTMKAGEGDKLFGSVTAADIAEKLKAEGFAVDKKAIDLDEPLKSLGVFKVPVRLHPEVKPDVRVWVVRE